MASRGARGISGMSRRFKIADDNGNGSLCLDEFKKVMQECNIELSEQVSPTPPYYTIVPPTFTLCSFPLCVS
jgi:hypothetical protein